MDILSIALLTLFASMVGTITGFGTSTIMIPVLAVFLPPMEAIFLVSIIHWFGNLWKVTLFKSGFNFKLFALFGISGLLASYFGATVSLQLDTQILLRLLGIFLAIYSLSLIIKTDLAIKPSTSMALFGGTLSGFFAGLFGIGGAIRSAFLLLFNLPKAVYIATAGAIGLLVDSTRIITYLIGGTTMPDRLWLSLLIFIPISFIGAELAKKVLHKIPQKQFRIVLAMALFILGIKLIFFP